MTTLRPIAAVATLTLALVGCSQNEVAPPEAAPAERGETITGGQAPGAEAPRPAMTQAAIGQPAPDFELPSLDGPKVRLSSLRGKTVVLEWFNPDCPFVKQAHARPAQLKGKGAEHAKQGVVWLAINSAAVGKQGYGPEANRAGKQGFGIDYPILLDEAGAVGRSYQATNTPHMYVIDAGGVLVYAGALDNTQGGDLEDVDPHVHHVERALADLAASRPVALAKTEAYGCSVKYAKN